MPATIANVYQGVDSTTADGNATCAITVAAGEGLLFEYYYEGDFGAPSAITSVVYDPTGANQTMTQVGLQRFTSVSGATNRWLALYELRNPTGTGAKNIVVTHSGGSTDRGGFMCANIAAFNTTTWITASNVRYEPNPGANDLPNTITGGATGELAVFFGAMRNEAAYFTAGNLSNYSEFAATSTRVMFLGTKAGAASVTGTFGYDESTEYDNALIAVSIASSSDTTPPDITSTGAGATNGPFAVAVAENSTAVAVTATSNEALGTVTKAGANAADYTLAGSGLTRTLARNAPGIDYEAWVLAGSVPEVVTLTFPDTATPTPNSRTVTFNFSPTNVIEPPGAPTIGTATPGNGQASVTFTPPSAGSAPTVIDFRATANPSGVFANGASSPITIPGLTNGVAQTITVKARNSDGFGADSVASNSVTPNVPASASLTGSVSPLNFVGSAGSNLIARRILSLPITNTVNGVLYANQTNVTAHVYALSGGLIVTLAGQTTNSSGIMELLSTSLVLGTEYAVRGILSDGVTEFYGRKIAEA